MNKLLLLGLTLLFSLVRCNSNKPKPEKLEDQKQVKPMPFDTLKYLEMFNSIDRLYEGTYTYLEATKKEKVILIMKYRNDLFEDGNTKLSKIDSITSWSTKDTLFISHIFFASGRCLNVYPYLENKSEYINLLSPEIVADAEIIIEDGRTLVAEEGCSLENVMEFIFKIPMSSIPNKKEILYRGKKIKPKYKK